MNAYVDLTTLKEHLFGATPSTDATRDDRLLALLVAASRQVDDACGEHPGGHRRHFYEEVATFDLDGNGADKLWVPDLLSVTSLAADEDGDGTYEASFVTGDYFLWPSHGPVYSALRINLNGARSQFGPRAREAVRVAGTWGYRDDGSGRTVANLTATETLGTALNATATSVTISATGDVAAGHTIKIDSEQMYVEAVSETTLTVIRGVNGTTAATHDSGKAITIYRYTPAVVEAVLLTVARLFKRSDSPFGIVTFADLGTGLRVPALDPDVRTLLRPFRLYTVAVGVL